MWFNEITKSVGVGVPVTRVELKGPHLLGFSSSRIRSHYNNTHILLTSTLATYMHM